MAISSIEVLSFDTEPTHTAKMQRVAQLITSPAPLWLNDLLSDWSVAIWSDHSIDEIWPTRREMRDTLVAIETLAVQLQKALKQPGPLGLFISDAGTSFGKSLKDGNRFLAELVLQVRQARTSPRLVTIDGKVLPGRGKTMLAGVMPAKYRCAAVIAEVWAFFHNGEDPFPSDRAALDAARELWEAWISSNSWSDQPHNGWKKYFKAVRNDNLQPLRSEVRRHLAIRSTDPTNAPEKNDP
jgi:hypothetical protein